MGSIVVLVGNIKVESAWVAKKMKKQLGALCELAARERGLRLALNALNAQIQWHAKNSIISFQKLLALFCAVTVKLVFVESKKLVQKDLPKKWRRKMHKQLKDKKMQKKKIFVEIGIPNSIKKRLMQKIEQWKDLPVKWMKEESLHITVSFVGYVDESVVPDICQKINEAVADFEAFEITFDRIELGPNIDDPKTVWFSGKSSAELGKLNEVIEQALGMHPEKHKEFCPHITLGRIRKIKWDELPQKPIIDEKFVVAMTVESVVVMDSKGGGAEYVPLEECVLA